MRYALVGPEAEIKYVQVINPSGVGTKQGWKWLPVVENERPKYNPKTHFAEPSTFKVIGDEVHEIFIIREKSQHEMDAERVQAIEGIGFPILQIMYAMDSRIRILDGGSVQTFDQFKIYLRGCI